MKDEHMLMYVLVFVLGFMVARMMGDWLVEGDDQKPPTPDMCIKTLCQSNKSEVMMNDKNTCSKAWNQTIEGPFTDDQLYDCIKTVCDNKGEEGNSVIKNKWCSAADVRSNSNRCKDIDKKIILPSDKLNIGESCCKTKQCRSNLICASNYLNESSQSENPNHTGFFMGVTSMKCQDPLTLF